MSAEIKKLRTAALMLQTRLVDAGLAPIATTMQPNDFTYVSFYIHDGACDFSIYVMVDGNIGVSKTPGVVCSVWDIEHALEEIVSFAANQRFRAGIQRRAGL